METFEFILVEAGVGTEGSIDLGHFARNELGVVEASGQDVGLRFSRAQWVPDSLLAGEWELEEAL